ncbi:hypothetical protein ACLOJK_032947 [Asimina triloba]
MTLHCRKKAVIKRNPKGKHAPDISQSPLPTTGDDMTGCRSPIIEPCAKRASFAEGAPTETLTISSSTKGDLSFLRGHVDSSATAMLVDGRYERPMPAVDPHDLVVESFEIGFHDNNFRGSLTEIPDFAEWGQHIVSQHDDILERASDICGLSMMGEPIDKYMPLNSVLAESPLANMVNGVIKKIQRIGSNDKESRHEADLEKSSIREQRFRSTTKE